MASQGFLQASQGWEADRRLSHPVPLSPEATCCLTWHSCCPFIPRSLIGLCGLGSSKQGNCSGSPRNVCFSSITIILTLLTFSSYLLHCSDRTHKDLVPSEALQVDQKPFLGVFGLKTTLVVISKWEPHPLTWVQCEMRSEPRWLMGWGPCVPVL